MKKIMLISLLVLLLALACSCVEEIDAEIPELGPMQSATKPTTAKPAPGIDPDDIPDTPDTSDDPSDPNNSDVPSTPSINDITFTESEEAQTSAISGYVSNANHSADGDVVEKYKSGETTIYKVCYGRTITFVVEITEKADTVKVEAFLEHYRLYMGEDKFADITIGDYNGRVDIPSLEWEENVSAKTLLASAEAPKGTADSVKIDVKIPFGGKYHNELIENLELSVDYNLK